MKETEAKKTKKKKRKFTKTRLFKILRIIFIIAIIAIIVNVILGITKKTSDDVTLIIGDKKIELKYDLLISDDSSVIYISKEDIANLYDENIYYNDEEQICITTYNKHVAKLEIGKSTMEVNSTEIAISGTLKEENGIIYLPILDLKDVYDFEYTYNDNYKVLMIDSISISKSEAVVLKNSKVKENTKFFSSTLEKIKKSDGVYVTVFETDGDYTKVRTNSGNIGYVKTKKLSDVTVLWDDMEEESLENVNILNDYNEVKDSYEISNLTQDNTYIVMPNLFNINEELQIENVIDLTSSTYESYSTLMINNEVNIAGTLTLSGSMNSLCSNYTSRTILINNLYNLYVTNKLSMICIEFEHIDDDEGFYRFIIELTPRFKEIGYKVLVKYHDGMDKDRLNSIVDYVVE